MSEPTEFAELLSKTKNLPDIYELVKLAVRRVFKMSRPGLMLGLADLGEGANAWIGGYHVISSNAIIMNSRPMKYIEQNHNLLFNSNIRYLNLTFPSNRILLNRHFEHS
jgi:hypothetical protein